MVILPSWAVDKSYYSSLNGKSGSNLRSALTVLLYQKHTKFSKYDWDFPYDYDSSGNMLDIYSNCGFNSNNSYTSDYKCCCDAINREHVICQSSFGGSGSKDKIPQYSDRYHLFPVDGRANGHRSDLPFGECSSGAHGNCSNASLVYPSEGTSTCTNHEFGKSGTSTFSVALPSGGGKVYEVGDDYKGDIARAVLYMVVRYAEAQYCRLPDGATYCTSSGGGTVSSNLTTANSYPVTAWANTTADKVGQMFSTSLSTNFGLSNYGKAILLKWHRQDPVSQKEIDRNAGVEAVQGNRNPFVDYPCLVEYLWGDHASESFNTSNVMGSFETAFAVGVSDGCSCATEPTITTPTGTIDFGSTNTSTPVAQTVTVKGINLTNSPSTLTLSLSGTNAGLFSLSTTSISKANAETGKAITITYTPTANGTHNATLTISGCGVTNHTVALTGSCTTGYTVTWMADGASYHSAIVSSGERPAIPETPDNCSATRVFRGWTAQSSVSSQPGDLFTTTAPIITSTTTFYAVYADATTVGTPNEYTLYSGNLEEGDYVVFFNGKAMKATVSSNRLGYADVTPSGSKITTTDETIIWHIAKSGSYWTLYNENVNKYAAANGTKNQAQLLDDGTDDMSLWTVSGTSTYEFVNKYNTAQGVNATLRNNGTYGFACYSTSTGGALSLYKTGSETTYSNYSLSCSSGLPATVTATFMNGTTQQTAVSGTSGAAISVSDATPCSDYTFVNWTTHTYATDNTASPTIDYTGNFPSTNTTYHAVFSKTVTTSGSGTGAPVGTTLWAEGFQGFAADDVPTAGNASTTVYNGGTVSYSCSNGSGTGTTMIYTTYLASGGAEAPELLICRTYGSLTIGNIPTANADSMTLTFKTNRTAPDLAITSSTTGISISSPSVSSKTATCGIRNNGAVNFTLTITNNNETTNGRFDDFLLAVSRAGTGSSTTTYYTTVPDCSDCTVTVTAVSEDETKGTAAVSE